MEVILKLSPILIYLLLCYVTFLPNMQLCLMIAIVAAVQVKWAPSSEFVSSSIPSWQILSAHSQPFRGARDLAFCLKVPVDSLLVWASNEDSGETARMRRLAWTFAARIGDKYQIRLTRSNSFVHSETIGLFKQVLIQEKCCLFHKKRGKRFWSKMRKLYSLCSVQLSRIESGTGKSTKRCALSKTSNDQSVHPHYLINPSCPSESLGSAHGGFG